MTHYRSVNSLKRKLDNMIKLNPKFTIDHGVSHYEFHHYEYEAPKFSNRWNGSITVYVVDFWNGKVIPYMTLTDSELKRPSKADMRYGYFGVSAYWEKEFPTILTIREYELI